MKEIMLPCRATTHSDLQLRAKALEIPVKIIHNASIMNAVGACGLQLYRFGEVNLRFCPALGDTHLLMFQSMHILFKMGVCSKHDNLQADFRNQCGSKEVLEDQGA